MTYDYNAKLAQDLSDIGAQTKAGNLPLEPRRAALDDATSRYALAQADHYAASPRAMPIALRNATLLDRAADAMLYEDLRWSHPDKMSIVEFPIMSDRQAETRRAKQFPKEDLPYGDMRGYGRRKSCVDDESDDDTYARDAVHSRKVIPPTDAGVTQAEASMAVRDALSSGVLSDKQRKAVELVFYEGMTQEEAATALGVAQHTVSVLLKYGIRNLRRYFAKQ